MKWFSGLNNHNREKYLDYIKMYTVAVVSAKETNPLIKPYLIFDGNKDEYIELLENLGVNILYEKSSIYDDLVIKYNNDSVALGAFLRVDIPKICHDLSIQDDYVLYTDNDVMFLDDVSELNKLTPKYFLCAGEFNKMLTNSLFNSGVMWINWKNMYKDYTNFKTFIKSKIPNFGAYDQGALQEYYGSRFEVLNYNFNYKPYWGFDKGIKILHFHGPKPTETELIDIHPLKNLATPYYFEMSKNFNIILNEINDNNNNIFKLN
jgi:lipopolysaccharide biosynthesis glycosyltransferase